MYKLKVINYVDMRQELDAAQGETVAELMAVADEEYPDFADGVNWECDILNDNGKLVAYRYDGEWTKIC